MTAKITITIDDNAKITLILVGIVIVVAVAAMFLTIHLMNERAESESFCLSKGMRYCLPDDKVCFSCKFGNNCCYRADGSSVEILEFAKVDGIYLIVKERD